VSTFSYPLLLEPVLVPKMWAGGRMAAIPGREAPSADAHIGESWDVSTWPAAPDDSALLTMSRISNGPLAGTALGDVAEVPVVVKVIDSGDFLSVQCHPHHPDEHKNEMWYLLEADREACLYLGFAEGVTPEAFCGLLREEPTRESRVMGSLRCYRDLKHGTQFSVPAPTVHALGPGLLTFEISERSQITYRLYDYDRPRSRGHLDLGPGCEALTTPVQPQAGLDPKLDLRGASRAETIAAFSTFCVVKVEGDRITVASAGHQHLVTASGGNCRIAGPGPEWGIDLGYSFTCLVPPAEKPYTIDTQGSGEVLISPVEGERGRKEGREGDGRRSEGEEALRRGRGGP
jgi:mannose-6-phosphate isomerase